MDTLKKDRECLHCKKFFDCDGKPKEIATCINYIERKVGDSVGRTQDVRKDNSSFR